MILTEENQKVVVIHDDENFLSLWYFNLMELLTEFYFFRSIQDTKV